MNPTTGRVLLHLPDGSVVDGDLTLTPLYHPWSDHLTFTATFTTSGADFTLNAALSHLTGARRDVARTLGIVTASTTPDLSVPVQLEGARDLLTAHHRAARAWLLECQTRDRLHHRPVLILHPGGGSALGHGRRLSQGEQQAARHGSFTPPGAVLARFLPRTRLQERPNLDLEDPSENDTTESGDRLRFIRPPDAQHP